MREGRRRISRKLDRVSVNDAWLDVYPTARACFDTPDVFDHSPGRVCLYEVPRRRNASFKFKNSWVKEEGFKEVVREAWYASFTGTRQFSVTMKLRRVKDALKVWNRSLGSDLVAQIEACRER